MLIWALADPKNLRWYVGLQGGASTLLHNGGLHTRQIHAEITILTNAGTNQYAFGLSNAAGDTFVFEYERYEFLSSQRMGCCGHWLS